MKRLIVLASAIALATISQAVSVQWTSDTIYLPDSTGAWSTTKSGSGAKQVSAYVFLSSSAFTDTAFDSYFNVDDSTGAITLKSGKNADGTAKTAYAGNANITAGEVSAGQTLYALVFYTYTDADKNGWYISGTSSATLGSDTDLKATVDPTNLASHYGKTAGWTSASAVPEPTTLALLALGLAAVGLKRKVA